LLMLLAKASGGVRIDIGNIAWPELSVDGRTPQHTQWHIR
jgi:hypothetical protein